MALSVTPLSTPMFDFTVGRPGSYIFTVLIVLYALVGITRYTPFPKPKGWLEPKGNTDAPRTPEEEEFLRRRSRFWLFCFLLLIAAFLVLDAAF